MTFLAAQESSGEVRARMGEAAHQRSDFVILTDSDPGLEDPKEIIQVGVLQGYCAMHVVQRSVLHPSMVHGTGSL